MLRYILPTISVGILLALAACVLAEYDYERGGVNITLSLPDGSGSLFGHVRYR